MKTLLIILRWPLFFGLCISSILSGQAQLNSPQPPPRFIKVTETGNEVEIFGVAGRFYQAQGSLDLEEWFDLGDPILGEGEEITIEVESSADSFFVRFGMNDRDPNDFDGDGVPNETELANGTDQFHPDSDRDGISDLDDSFPLANQMAADPDGFNLPPSLERGLVWRWDFENVAVVGGKSRLPAKVRGERNFLEASNARGYRPGKGVVSAAVQLAPFGTVSAPKATPVLKFSRLYKNRIGQLFEYNALFGDDGTEDASFCQWVRFGPGSLNQLTNDLTFLSLGRKSGYSWQSDLHLFLTQDDEIRFETDGSLRGLRYQYQKWATPENLDDGQWHHFTFVLAGHDAKIYYDGVELPVTTFNPFPLRDELIAGIPQGSAANLGFFYYGQRTPIDRSLGSPRVTLDRVRFYDREITLSEAQALYHHDLDGDGFQDRVEGQADFWTDANGDGIRDFEELRWVMNPFHRDPADADHDGDTLTSWFELNDVIKTSPKKPDTDDDGLPDPWERLFGLDPNTPSPSEGDTDADGLTDLEEYLLGTYPNESDTDGDGQLDGNDPTPTTENDPAEGPDAPAPTFVLIVTTEGTPKAESQEIGYGADFQPLSPQSDGKGLPERSTQKSTLQLKRSSAELPADYLCFRAGDSGEGENKTVLVGVFSFAAGALVSEPIKEVRGPKVVAEEEESTDQPSSGNLALNLLPVEIKVNDTIKEEDDFVAVSKDITDEDLATDFSVKVSAMGGLTADLKVKGADGGIKFKEQTLMLTDGVEAKTKLWGISPSSAKEKTIVEITLKKDGKEIGKIEEDVTVFEGVEVRYEGRTYSNIDTREFGRRPWDGRKDPKPNSKYDPVIKPKAPGDEDLAMYIPGMKGMEVLANIAETNNFDYHSHDYRGHKTLIPDLARYRATVDVDEAYGYASAFSFELNDNKGITSYRPWTDTSLISVKVVGLYTIKPRVEVEDDPLLDKSLSLEDGSLSNVGNNDEFVDDGVEIFRNPIMHIDGELTAKSAGKKTDTGIRGGTELVAGDRFSDTSDPKFDLDISDLNSDVSNYINDSSKPQAQRDLAKVLRANSFVLPKEVIFSWKNDAMEFEKNTNSKSVFTKHIVHQVESKTATYRNRLTWAGLHEASGTSLIIDGKIIKQQ